jgi:hypothetical protein
MHGFLVSCIPPTEVGCGSTEVEDHKSTQSGMPATTRFE